MLLLAVLGFLTYADVQMNSEYLRAMHTAYDANIQAIDSAHVEFTYSVGSTSGPEAALRGDWDQKSTAKGRLVFAGSTAQYERIFPLEEMIEKRHELDGKRFSNSLVSVRLLTDGSLTLYDNLVPDMPGKAMIHSAQIHPGTNMFKSYAEFPLGLGGTKSGYLGLSGYIRKSEEKGSGVAVTAVDDVTLPGGRKGTKISFSSSSGGATFWVDVERGALPVKMEITKASLFTTVLLDDLRQVENGSWLPFRQVLHIRPALTQETRLDSISAVNKGVDSSSFTLVFPQPVGLINRGERVLYPKRKAWSLHELPTPKSAGTLSLDELQSKRAEETVPQMPGESDNSYRWGAPVLLSGGLLLFVAGAVAYRRRKAA